MDSLHIRKVLSGDHEAFRYFIKKYSKMAFAIAISIVKDQQAAEECVQDGFLKAYKALSMFKQDSKFSSWLYTIIKNEALYYLKKHKRCPIEYVASVDDQIADESHLLSLDKQQQSRLVQMAMQQLPSQENLMLRLFYIEQYSIRQISDTTGKKESNIKVLLHRGRKHMLSIINQLLNQ